jgi:hypothetical protein
MAHVVNGGHRIGNGIMLKSFRLRNNQNAKRVERLGRWALRSLSTGNKKKTCDSKGGNGCGGPRE